MLRQQMAKRVMGESLVNSIVTSMLRTDYVRTLQMDDTVASYTTIYTLHLYPLLLRLQQYPNEEVSLYCFVSMLFNTSLVPNVVQCTM